ncbi:MULTISPECIES: mobile mystery protein B [Pseudomonas]|uniref:Fic-DOC domain mobile mystery protein B n=1 Tax=Pseudomonas poae TaxID=200451 RepID=A0A7Z1K0S4_9PSED|nr:MULTISPECIES: mobile mystery protein B [Pseudomonas]HAA41672.1 mobile mystery protein B [Pseudomonas sp.]PFG60566.1 Fic-DOC domain mobile mystery protein B [Pseudomonas poae]PUB47151.1 Fic-DOC domain mobile mystery protein B [Pseudomonas sp. GV047]SCX14118.1 mobile mystery protein B [Pseudomonas sp. NFACC25]SMF37725.1 mobile mystery protein B [Pseudomonas sp. LAMO17WK12:I1]
MAIELELKPGQTPLDPDEVAGLKPRHIATQGELDEWEAQNILKASRWVARQKKLDVLNDHFCRELHVKMFDDTWKWAGTFRKSDKNIGCDWTQIAVNLRQLLDNVAYWLEHNVFPPEEIAVRFHHRLVWLHAFPNGNGRHARLMTDCLLRQCGLAPFSWGRGNLVIVNEVRHRYIQSLRAADANDYALLSAFVRS